MPDQHNQDDNSHILNVAQDAVVAGPVTPQSAKSRTFKGFSNGSGFLQFGHSSHMFQNSLARHMVEGHKSLFRLWKKFKLRRDAITNLTFPLCEPLCYNK